MSFYHEGGEFYHTCGDQQLNMVVFQNWLVLVA